MITGVSPLGNTYLPLSPDLAQLLVSIENNGDVQQALRNAGLDLKGGRA